VTVNDATTPTTVTFVFSDLEGSTRLLNSLRGSYGPLLEQYHELIDATFAGHGGTKIDQAGDGLFHSFSSARGAIAAATEAQLAMASHEWPQGVSVRARMGIHTGEAANRRAGYVGIDVHRAARIASAGHGGQVLVSQTTRDLAGSDLPSDATLVDLGEHWLKDLAQPEHLYQVSVDGLPQAFPPLKSLVTLPNNLPRHLSSFVGRRNDVSEVRQLTTESPLVTLTGPGGVGKTRLCLQVAAELLENFADGAWLVELEALTDAGLVPQQVAVALGISEASDADSRESVLSHLRGRELLLILDNCEHVIDACAQLANSLLRACPGLRIIATSREPLGVAGERLYPVRSLSLPTVKRVTAEMVAESEAISLFIERAQSADPTFAITDANAAAIVEICRRLDGIPLAIELAAARVRALSVEQIAERLDDRFRLLTGGSRTVMPRHQTLRAAIEWSFDLLSDAERLVLWRLSVFAGPFPLEAAEKVCTGPGVEVWEVIDHVTTLVEKSLVARQADRYRLLDTVRGYAREHSLEAGESQGAFERHRDWYLDFVRSSAPAFFRGPELAAVLDRLEAEHDNVRAALAWSLNEEGGGHAALELVAGVWRFWEIRGYVTEGRQWVERALAASPTDLSRARADVLTAAGILAAGQGDHAAAVRYHEASLELHEEIGDRKSVEIALHNLANAALHQGNLERARELYERVLAVADPSTTEISFVLVNLADVIDGQGDYEAAVDRYQQAINRSTASDDLWVAAYAMSAFGQAAARHGETDTARELYEKALDIYRRVRDQRAEARLMTMLAELIGQQGDTPGAREILFDALRIRCSLGDAPGICAALEHFSALAQDADPERAARILAAAAAMRERTGARLSMAAQGAVDQQLAQLQSVLGDEFARAWRQGNGASVDEALRDAAAVVGR